MTGHVRRICEQPIYRNQSRYPRENGQQEIEGYPGCNQQDAVFRDTVINPKENVLPPRGRNIRGPVRGSSATVFRRCAIPALGRLALGGLTPGRLTLGRLTLGRLLAGPALAEAHGEQERGKPDGPPGVGLRPPERYICTQISGAHARGPCEKRLARGGLVARAACCSFCRRSGSSSRLQIEHEPCR